MAALIASLKTTFTGYFKYRGREGQLSFLLHRLTGLGTLLFLIIHIVDTATVYYFPSLYNHAIEIYRSTPFMIGEIFLVFSVIFHGVNGLRISILDLYYPAKWTIKIQRTAVRHTLLLSVLLWLVPAYIMLRNMLVHNFGMFGG
ncbi:MAG: succinate dehydrogenase, cytochrome b556 subunit [Anaerolineae bacterium]|nr:succinate dehydrogenase, cytochrome b556 subunit [Anaerolineae bacterium]